VSTAEHNRQLVEDIYTAMNRGNPSAFVDALADTVRWRTSGQSAWSRTFEGKTSVLVDLLGTLFAQLAGGLELTPHSITAGGDRVVVEAAGKATTHAGEAYDNQYCFVYRIEDDKIVEVTEYFDTELAVARLQPPPPEGRTDGESLPPSHPPGTATSHDGETP
jgi:ketosteroid isomerase-like protein